MTEKVEVENELNRLADMIIRYEDGRMTDDETIEFFQYLVSTGLAWSLQGSYGRMANMLIDAGHVTRPKETTT